jgi:hypothetical protein
VLRPLIRCFSSRDQQPTPDRSVRWIGRRADGMLEVGRTSRATTRLRSPDDAIEAVAPIASRLPPDRVLDLVQPLLAQTRRRPAARTGSRGTEPLSRQPQSPTYRFVGCKRQAAIRVTHGANLVQCGVGVLSGSCRARRSHPHTAPYRKPECPSACPAVRIELDAAAEHRTLWCPPVGGPTFETLQDYRPATTADQIARPAVNDPAPRSAATRRCADRRSSLQDRHPRHA